MVNNILIKFLAFFLYFFILSITLIAHAKTTIKGEIIAGGIILVNTFPGSNARLDGNNILVSDQGTFILGFQRDPSPIQVLEIILDNQVKEKITLNVKKRSYNIQRINGIEKEKVDPPKSVLDRIYLERKSVKESRNKALLIKDLFYNNGFSVPASGPISGVYGSQRILNGKAKSPHYGIDIALPEGNKVIAPMDGIVLFTHDDLYFSGGTIIIGHGQGLTTSYLHLSEVSVKNDDIVKRGDLIGKVGSTGRATGPHLHWGVELNGKRLDPQYLKVFKK
jgi:murein DD-endopeptidase MepM/ murein hydrolase activator NlpD